MYGKKLKDTLIETKKQLEQKYVIVYNNGKTETKLGSEIFGVDSKNQFYKINFAFEDACDYYGRRNSFDNLDMKLYIGAVYREEDVVNGKVKYGVKPVSELVHFITGDINSYLNGEKTNKKSYLDSNYTKKSFSNYSYIVSQAKEEGIDYYGPKTFEELYVRINNGEKFDIDLSLSLIEEEKKEKSKILSLFKRK